MQAANALLVPLAATTPDFCSTVQFLSMMDQVLDQLTQAGIEVDYSVRSPDLLQVRRQRSQPRHGPRDHGADFRPGLLPVPILESAEISHAAMRMMTIYEWKSRSARHAQALQGQPRRGAGPDRATGAHRLGPQPESGRGAAGQWVSALDLFPGETSLGGEWDFPFLHPRCPQYVPIQFPAFEVIHGTQAIRLSRRPALRRRCALPAPAAEPAAERARGTTLLGRESALARVASGEVRQVTQLLLDPARVRPGRQCPQLCAPDGRVLPRTARFDHRRGGQKVPAVVRRIEGDPAHDYEVIAGTRRHWSISWLRAHSYPDMQFVAQVAQLDDEAAFRLADLENRARKDVSDLERARNYAEALKLHYGSHLTRMAERLKLSKGWLSKMLKVAALPDGVIAAFASPADVQLKPAYALAQALDDKDKAPAIRKEATRLAKDQAARREAAALPCPPPTCCAPCLPRPIRRAKSR
jgi:ParB family chromosome partitioning protein